MNLLYVTFATVMQKKGQVRIQCNNVKRFSLKDRKNNNDLVKQQLI